MNAITTIDGKPVDPSRVKQIDADTVEVDGQRHRLSGMNAPETAKVQGGIFVPAQVSQDDTEQVINQLATQGGYTNLRPTGKIDPYGRSVSDQVNERGQNLGDMATVLGLTRLTPYTADEVIRNQSAMRAAATLFPSLKGHDPVVKMALDRQDEFANGERKVFFPKQVVENERVYAAIKGSIGIKAVQNSIEEIGRLNKIMDAADTPVHIRTETAQKLNVERNNLLIAATTEDPAGGVMVRRPDRSIMNEARNQIGTSWSLGLSSAYEAFGGIAQLAGDQAKWDWLSNKGQQIITREQMAQNDLPTVLNSYKDINTRDPWEAVKDTTLWVGNNLTSSLPIMAALVGGSVAAGDAAVPSSIAGAVATIPAALLYSGQYYAEQAEGKKDATKAIGYGVGSAALEKIGLNGMLGANLLTRAGRKEAASLMVERQLARTTAEAETLLLNATRREILELAEHSAAFAKRELASVDRLAKGAQALAVGAGLEAGTEAGQTFMEMLATTGKTAGDLLYEKGFEEQLINAAAAGGAIGGTFKLGSGLYDTAQWHSAMDAIQTNKKMQDDNLRFNTKMQVEGIAGEGKFSNIAQAAQHFNINADSKLADLKGNEGTWEGLKALVTDPLRAVRGLASTVTKGVSRDDGSFREYRGVLKAIMTGGGLMPGENYAGFKQRLIGSWSGDSIDKLAQKMKTNTKRAEVMLREAAQDYWVKGEDIPASTPHAEALQEWRDITQRNKEKILSVAQRFGVEMPELAEQDFLLQSALITPKRIHEHRPRLLHYLKEQGMSDRQAEDTLNGIVSGNSTLAAPAAEVLRKVGAFSNKDLNDIFEPNIFGAMEAVKLRLSNKIANKVFLGEDGRVLANLLEKAKAAGEFETDNEYRDAVTNVKAWYDIETGNYNPMKDYPVLEKILGWGTTLTMLAGLGKATISSIPEMAFAMLGTKGNLMFQQTHLAVKEFAQEYRADFNKVGSSAAAALGLHYARNVYDSGAEYSAKIDALQARYDKLAQDPKSSPVKMKALADDIQTLWRRDFGRELFDVLGYNDPSYNIQAKYELPNAKMKKMMHAFATIIGLRALTDGNRMATLAVASDSFITKLALLGGLPGKTRTEQIQNYQGLSNEQAQAVKELTQFGMDIPMILDFLDVRDAAPSELFATDSLTQGTGIPPIVQDNLLAALGNFVDSKIVNPQPHNLPKYYYDPRFRIITAMTRFVAAQTTTVLPNLYKNYIKDGSAAMRYQAFATIFSALLFAAMADALKDELAYKDGKNPFIKGELARAQKTVYGAGLLGKGESAVSMFAPIYPEVKDPSLWDRAKDVSPVLSWGDRAVRGVYNVTSPDGKTETGKRQIFKSLPLVGSYPRLQEVLDPTKE